ncbi:MAG TPA: hypothetical protein V6D11_15015 [Waterburya sp.]
MSYEINENTQQEDAQLSDATANADLELSDEDLEAVAGGSGHHDHHHKKHHHNHHHDHHEHHGHDKKDDYCH